jgi:ribosomal protein S18 acetylase RimI-like enzyme
MLRAARPEDRAAVGEVFLAARRDALPYLPELHTDEDTRAFVAGLVDKGIVTVAEHEGRVAGFLALDGDWVDHLYIAPGAQGRGLGSALLRAAQAQRERLQLWVFQRNTRAIAFYERHGFAVAERTDGAGNEERTPDARMTWVRPGTPPAPNPG